MDSSDIIHTHSSGRNSLSVASARSQSPTDMDNLWITCEKKKKCVKKISSVKFFFIELKHLLSRIFYIIVYKAIKKFVFQKVNRCQRKTLSKGLRMRFSQN
jgi:hypothetical protein